MRRIFVVRPSTNAIYSVLVLVQCWEIFVSCIDVKFQQNTYHAVCNTSVGFYNNVIPQTKRLDGLASQVSIQIVVQPSEPRNAFNVDYSLSNVLACS